MALPSDLRFALRLLTKNPGFAAVAVLTLALGIGGNSAIFSVVNALLLRPLPYPHSDQLVRLHETMRMRGVVERAPVSYIDFRDWERQSNSFTTMAAYTDNAMTLQGTGETERLSAEYVTAGYLDTVGVQPVQGRGFRRDEDRIGANSSVVLVSDSLWRRRFGADPGLVGRTLLLNDRSWTVIGILPAGFAGLTDRAEVWALLTQGLPERAIQERVNMFLQAVGRLKPNVAVTQAQADLSAVAGNLAKAYPDTNRIRGVEVLPLQQDLFGDLEPALLLLLCAVGVVLLMVCVNMANLLLARTEYRQREIAIRAALGADRGRLVRQLLTESLVLCILGGALGVLVSAWATSGLVALRPVNLPSFVAVTLDVRVLAFTLGVALLASVLMGLAPAWSATRTSLDVSLREASRGTSGLSSARLRDGLIAAEVALAVVILVGAGLLAQTFRHLSTVDAGFRTDHLLSLRLMLPPADEPGRTASQMQRLTEAVLAAPGVQQVALSSDTPLDFLISATSFLAEGQSRPARDTLQRIFTHSVARGFFTTYGIPFRAGRDFHPEELTRDAQVAILSESAQRRYFPAGAVGRRVTLTPDQDPREFFVVGVVGDVLARGLPRNPDGDPDIYLPLPRDARNVALTLRTTADPLSLVPGVRARLRDVEPNAPVWAVSSMEERLERQTARSRFTSVLMAFFSGAALLLAMVGIYGVTAYGVAQRTREIGIRIVLGAARGSVVGMVLRRVLTLAAIGVVLGVLAALGLVRFVSSLLYGVEPTDTWTFTTVIAALLAMATLACAIPARRATRIDPVVALRNE